MAKVEEMDSLFARIVKLSYYAGLVLMFISAVLYFIGINQSLSPHIIIERWGESTTIFWKDIDNLLNYKYLKNLQYSDSVILLAVTLITLTPLAGIILAISRAKLVYKILLLILVLELIIAVLQPLYFKI
jgi:hypothetical protein